MKRSQLNLYIILIPFITTTSSYSRKNVLCMNFVKQIQRQSSTSGPTAGPLKWMLTKGQKDILCPPLSPETHWSQGSWESQWSRNQHVPLRPEMYCHVNQWHAGLPRHMSWHVPTNTLYTMSKLLSSVMSHVAWVYTSQSSLCLHWHVSTSTPEAGPDTQAWHICSVSQCLSR